MRTDFFHRLASDGYRSYWRVLDQALEITYSPVTDGQEGDEEQVFALHTDPPRQDTFGCHSNNGMRSDRQAPRATANEIFDRTADVATAPIQDAAAGQWVGTVWASPEATTTSWTRVGAGHSVEHPDNLGLWR